MKPHIFIERVDAPSVTVPFAPGDRLSVVDGCLLIMNGMITCKTALGAGEWRRAQILDDKTAPGAVDEPPSPGDGLEEEIPF